MSARDFGAKTERAGFWTLWGAFLLAGIGFRLVQYFAARSLWLDESMLALNVASRSPRDLLRPLDYHPANVDEGWAANEARRIARSADPCAWMYFTHLSERANKPITWHLRDDHRGRVWRLVEAPGGVLYRYCFPRTPEQIEKLERWKAEQGH